MSYKVGLSIFSLCFLCFIQAQSAFCVEEIYPKMVQPPKLEEVKLDNNEPSLSQKILSKNIDVEIGTPENSFIDKIINQTEDAYYNSPKLDFIRPAGVEINKGILKSYRFDMNYAFNGMMFSKPDEPSKFQYENMTVEFGSSFRFKDNKSKIFFHYDLADRPRYDNNFTKHFNDLIYEYNFNDNQRLRVGVERSPNGYNGSMSLNDGKFYKRSQLATVTGNVRAFGIRNTGDYKYINYDLGLYDASRYMDKMFHGIEFIARGSVKPLAKFDDKYGKLYVGGSVDLVKRDGDFKNFNAFAIYRKNRFYWDAEYSYMDGFSATFTPNKAHGFYTTLGYMIAPKLELVGRYDIFDNKTKNEFSTEYTAGLMYHYTKTNRLGLQYTLATSDKSSKPEHRVAIVYRFVLSRFMQNRTEKL